MEFTGHQRDLEARIAKLEEPLLKDDAQSFFAQQLCSMLQGQLGLDPITSFAGQQVRVIRKPWKFKQIQGTIHGVHGEEARPRIPMFHVEQKVLHVDVRKSTQGAATDSPIERGESSGRKG